jgi:hypothetical protein
VTASSNLEAGIVVSDGSGLACHGLYRLEASHQPIGIQIQNTSSGFIASEEPGSTLVVDGNSSGIIVLGNSSFATSRLDATGNYRVAALINSSVFDLYRFGGRLTDNTVGITVGMNSQLRVTSADDPVEIDECSAGLMLFEGGGASIVGLDVSCDGGYGLWVDGGELSTYAMTALGSLIDVYLVFGSRAEFVGDDVAGSVFCDDTVLVRGDISCPAVTAGGVDPTAKRSPQSDWILEHRGPVAEELPLD